MDKEALPNNLTKGDQIGKVIRHFQMGVGTSVNLDDIPTEPTPEDIENFISENHLDELSQEDIDSLKSQIVADYRVNAPKKDIEQ